MADTVNVPIIFDDWTSISVAATSGLFENGGAGQIFYARSAVKPAVDFIGHNLKAGDVQRVESALIWGKTITKDSESTIIFTED